MTDAPLPDTSDLKTYDVPDPIEPQGSFMRACGLAIVGVGVAVGFLHVTRGAHYFAVFQNPQERWAQDTARNLISELPPSEVLERVLALDDLPSKGAFHKILASTGEATHVPAIVAYLEKLPGSRYSEGRAAQDAISSLGEFEPAQVGPALLELLVQEKAHPRAREPIMKALDGYPPEVLLEGVLAIENPVKRGRWHRVLAKSGDPQQIDAIFAYVQSRVASTETRFDAEAQSLLAFGREGTDKLKDALNSDSRPVVNLAAEALRTVNLAFLIEYTREQLDAYAAGIFGEGGLRGAYLTLQAKERQTEDPASILKPENRVTDEQVSAAKVVITKFERHSFLIMEMLKAMKPVPENEGVDFCFVHGLSSFNRPVAEYCAATLQQRLTPQKLIDVLFRYIAKKDEFDVREVEVYEDMLRATGAAGGTRIIHNLKRLLDEKAGKPTDVFWIYKKMAFQVLQQTGTLEAVPTLELYQADTDSYLHTTESRTAGRRRVEVFFKDQAAKAIEAIKARGK